MPRSSTSAREQPAVDRDMAHARIERGHRVERLHHLGAVLAGEREIGLEAIIAVERLYARERVLVLLGRMAADMQQREHEGIELVSARNGGEAQADIGALALDRERGAARIIVAAHIGNIVGEARDLLQQLGELCGFLAVVERGGERDGRDDAREIGLQLGFQSGVQHLSTPDFLREKQSPHPEEPAQRASRRMGRRAFWSILRGFLRSAKSASG